MKKQMKKVGGKTVQEVLELDKSDLAEWIAEHTSEEEIRRVFIEDLCNSEYGYAWERIAEIFGMEEKDVLKLVD